MTNSNNIPQELKQTPQWVLWKYEEKKGKSTKIPYTPSGTRASTSNSDTWSSFSQVTPHIKHFEGIGFVFTETDPYCGIDVDDCIDENRNIHPEAKKIVEQFNSYSEISPSGSGIKIFIKGKKNTSKCKKHLIDPVSIELYDTGRYFTVTSEILDDAPLSLEERQSELETFERQYFPKSSTANKKSINKKGTPVTDVDLDQIISTIRKSKDGLMFTELYDQGNTDRYNNDDSKADYSLLSLIAPYCDLNPAAMEGLFSKSALGQRNKWTKRKDYRDRTIQKVLQDSIKNSDDHYASILKDHYILGKRLIRIDLTSDGGYHITDTTKDVVYVKVGATTKEQRRDCWQWLVNNKELPYIEHVESRSDPDAKTPSYTYDKETGILCIHVAPIQPQIKENDMIEDYLQATFGMYKPFIKQYMAAYAFTNFRQLPTLICYGERGTSKSTFAQILSMMFPRLYCDWSGDMSTYSYEAAAKLAVIEENSTVDKQQYKTIKKYAGQKYLSVNKKYMPVYQVRNNLSVILNSNNSVPLYVEKDEMPTDPRNNQFFVWKFTKVIDRPDPDFTIKIKERLGNYIQTELRSVYESLDLSTSRYTIEVPITTYERELFNSSVTNTELIAEQVLEDILMDASKYFRSADPFGNTQINVSTHQMYLSQLKNGRMPNQLIKHYLSSDRNFADCIRYFTEKRYITGGSKRKMVNGEQFRYYSIQRWDSLDETLTENDRDADSTQVPSGIASGGEDS